jgi:glutaminase
MMVIIPGLMGIGVWSPRLDEHGNTVRGIEFCRKLVAEYNVHVFDTLASGPGRSIKRDPAARRTNPRSKAWSRSAGRPA